MDEMAITGVSSHNPFLKTLSSKQIMSELETGADSIWKFLHELDIRIRARYPLIAINTFEEDRVREAFIRKSLSTFGAVQAAFRRWSIRKTDY